MRGFWKFFIYAILPLQMASSFEMNWKQLEILKSCAESKPLGMISGHIQDWQITASSTYPMEWDRGCHERYARVYQPNGLAWCAKHKSQSEWLQVDLGVAAKISGVIIQGRGDGKEWVKTYMISYSMDAFNWQYVTDQYGNQRLFEGNTDAFSVKHSYLDSPVIARFVKFHTTAWNQHPSMRVEIIGCQGCKEVLGMPPYGKITASSEKHFRGGSSCRAEDGFILTNKGWCSKKQDDSDPWLQYDIGPPTLVTGVVTKGRGDRRKEWVTRFRLSYSNDSNVWYFYKDASHLDAKEFGGNVDKDLERYHYLNKPFVARYIRFHPRDWHYKVSMRAGLIGCPHSGTCTDGFMRVNDDTPCVENIAYQKESWINNKPQQIKRHIRNEWTHGQAARAVDGVVNKELHTCTILDNFNVEKPVWMVDLGSKRKVSGVVIMTWQGDEQDVTPNYKDYLNNLDKLVVYVDNKPDKDSENNQDIICGYISRLNGAVFRSKIHVQCMRTMEGRYLYIEAWGGQNRYKRHYNAILCEVMVYE